ncbi:tripartite tricarboxylate transporter TctB family protein [Martelella soudanensis]|uniref:tripartite tricarboxylate transporter TctB family protein n=1 Tax=unclassified Martelella TaxID=2629616 RepID=UPI0015DD8B1F|nr:MULTISPECIES: tripartite tricarboxylate transporter TctB family protein [unclassified Martelella]
MLKRLSAQAGTLLIGAIALVFIVGSLTVLDLGTPRRMGPGAFPLIAGGILAILAAVALVGDIKAGAEHLKVDWRAVVPIALAVASFALVTPRFGVLPGAGICVLIASFAVGALSPWRRAGLVIGAVLGVWLVFIVGLRLPLEAFRGF